MAPESFVAALIVRLTLLDPSESRTMAEVPQPAGATFAADCTRVTVIALSMVQEAPVQVVVKAPGKKTGGMERGLAENAESPPTVTELTVQAAVRQTVPEACG